MEFKFDKMEVDTTLAQEYLKSEELLQGWETSGIPYFDGKTLWKLFDYPPNTECLDISQILQNLAVLLKENINLFAQLEYLTRNICIEDTKAQVYLIIHQLHYLSSKYNPLHLRTDSEDVNTHFKMSNETPLLYLGFIARRFLYCNFNPTIVAGKETLAICYLFTKLCHNAGLPVVTKFVGNGNTVEWKASGNEFSGSVGVVSESSDVDSAVDMFLTSSTQVQVPWRLRRILVQESAYKQFKDALTWKCNLNKAGETPSDILHFNGRVFLIDGTDNADPRPSEVVVEAYRTRKELLSILNQYRPHYLSLWANDVAEINEVAHSISTTQVVWVNNFADFRGPPTISEAIYSVRAMYNLYNVRATKAELCKLSELKSSWLKLNNDTRYEILSKTLNENAPKPSDKNNYYTTLKNSLLEVKCNSSGTFVSVGNDYVCLGVGTSFDGIYFGQNAETHFFNEAFIRSLLHGNAFVFENPKPEISIIIDSLKKAGVPVIRLLGNSGDTVFSTYNIYGAVRDSDQVTKVIWTNSGTIFAN